MFVGLFPASAPELSIAIVVEHGEHGSATARLVKDLVLRYIEFKEQDENGDLAGTLN